jgi:hypothetical protein
MSENVNHVLSPFSRQAAPFTWLIYDVFLLLILLSGLLFYQDLDVQMQSLVRLHFVHSVAVFLFSGLHLLAFNRHLDARDVLRRNVPGTTYVQFSAWKSYGLYGAKGAAAAAFIYVAFVRGHLS